MRLPKERRRLLRPGFHLLVIAIAVALWVGAIRRTDPADIGDLGLLNAFPASYFAVVGVLSVGFAILIGGRKSVRWIAPVYVLALIFCLHGVAPVIYDEPRYAWVYKHVGVVDLIVHSGPPERGLDIYANWPAFFGFGAWFERVSGVPALDFVPWAQIFFNCAFVAALSFLYRGLTDRAALIWTAIWLFVLGNWIGQDIFAPQSFAFVALIAIVGIAVRCGPVAHKPRNWLERAIARVPALKDGGSRPEQPPLLTPAAALAAAGVCFAATVVSHQLTPIVMILFAMGFALIARRMPLWVVAVAILAEAAWIAAAFGHIGDSYDLLNFSPLERLGPQETLSGDPVSAQSFVAWSARGVVLLLALLALAGAWKRYRAGKRDVELWVLMVAPLVIVPLQSYGGEAPLRAFLFALPGLAFMGAALILDYTPGRPRLFTGLKVALVSSAVATLTLVAYFGLERVNHIDRDDVAATLWIERCAESDAVVTYIAPMFPSRASAGYARLRLQTSPTRPNLLEDGPPGRRKWGSAEVNELKDISRRNPGAASYVVVSPSQEHYLDLYGLVEPGSVPALKTALAGSSDYELAFRHGDAVVYRLKQSGRRSPVCV